ncbi:CHASE2 domain-containing protein [Planktothrix sp. FACHB-1355]|uniref:CHASE2 domain-containing protein n=1 Tax=Aerosakkonema funiforme FACHB-1375 TaxID=2949571 RepID=A0A926VB60_9CYAN|nr:MULTISPECIES: CHASE2 domain-containing protein [Oscillatoriales]MBD2180583.1 CHASE2 domain-containing protein [Aerosakkonema funiforme FACHB-1375]MBD3562391.1 CHASE2 domain-containing protein [Planktothrix sp. FACHB-1355]
MNKLVILNLGKGNLQNGFPVVVAQLREAGNSNLIQFTGNLPAAPEIIDSYRRWQLLYEMLYEARYKGAAWRQKRLTDDDIEIDDADVTHVSDAEFFSIGQQLQNRIDNWLDSQEFRPVDRQLRMRLAISDEIRVVIQTEDTQVRKLPWHLWNFFKDYRQAEVALSTLDFGLEKKPYQTATEKVRVLAVLGDRTGIDIDTDTRLLKNLPHAEVVFLVEPQRQELDEQLWDRQGWDILFFAGHSSSQTDGETGEIYINFQESLTITQLKNALTRAISRRLQLAIFNSCDGLGLGRELASLQIPQMIVMREPVPDKVAQEFLKYFLTAFSAGDSFYLAVREARERLQGLESDFPGASWLPVVICQDLAAEPPTWEKLRISKNDRELPIPPPPVPKPKLQTVFMVSCIITSLVVGVRSLGWLQSWELNAYDQMMRLRSLQEPDERLLVVRVTQQDLQQLREDPLSDRTVAALLAKLQQYKPIVIGLDIYRDKPVGKGQIDLKKQLEHGYNIIAVCKSGSDEEPENYGYQPPPGVPEERLGFSDFVPDKDGIIRRHLFYLTPETSFPCKARYALSTQLALTYLKTKGILHDEKANFLKFRDVVFKPLEKNTGVYQQSDKYTDMLGHQMMLNYRPYRYLGDISQQVTLMKVLNGDVKPEFIKDRIVLIGYDDDAFSTPYPAIEQPNQKTPGVFIHAQMVSQIISTVLDRRSLIMFLHSWGETLFIWSSSIVGGILAWHFRKLLLLGLSGTVALGILYCICYIIFLIQSYWMPFVPAALALLLTGTFVVTSTKIKSTKLGGQK